MHIIEVIPIARAITKEKLTYFSSEAPPLGSIVTVPLRGKKARGIVSDVRDARSEKALIKSADFELKKIDSFSPKEIVPRAFTECARELSRFYVATVGSVLWSTLPHTIIQHPATLPITDPVSPQIRTIKTTVVRGAVEERLGNYRAAIREYFAQKRSVYICVPTIEDAEYIAGELARGIESYTYVLHSEIAKKKSIEIWNTLHGETHPILVVGTSLFLSIPRQDIGLIIIEREGSRAYRMQSRPYIDLRRLVSTYAEHIGADVMKGDIVVSAESWYQTHNNELGNVEYREERPEHLPHLSLIDMSTYKLEEKKPFRTISDELEALITRTIRDKKRLFLFTPRKGLFPTTVCGDCGTTALCARCSAPVVVHKGNHEGEYVFLCHHCGKERPTEERCVHCGSWKLAALGVGIERVFDDLKKAYPEAPIFMLDKHSEPTRVKARKRVQAFETTPGAILIGTEYALLYLREIDSSAVVSLDSLFLIPDFRMHEKILGILSTIQSKTHSELLIQTRTPSNVLFGYLPRKTLRDFYSAEIEDRRTFGYPPFTFYIKLTRTGKQENVTADIQALEERLKKYAPMSYPGRIEKIRGAYIMHILLKLQPGDWIDEELRTTLASLPPYWSIRVDPDSLL